MRWTPARFVLAVFVSLAPGVSGAQSSIPPGATRPVAPTGPTVENQEVEGLIRRVIQK